MNWWTLQSILLKSRYRNISIFITAKCRELYSSSSRVVHVLSNSGWVHRMWFRAERKREIELQLLVLLITWKTERCLGHYLFCSFLKYSVVEEMNGNYFKYWCISVITGKWYTSLWLNCLDSCLAYCRCSLSCNIAFDETCPNCRFGHDR